MDPGTYNILLATADPLDKAVLSDALLKLRDGSTFRLSHVCRLDETLAQARSRSFHLIEVALERNGPLIKWMLRSRMKQKGGS